VYVGFLFVVVAVCISLSQPISLAEDNINTVRSSFCSFGDGDWSALVDLYTPGYLQHLPDFNDPVTFKAYFSSCYLVHSRVPDLQIRIVDIFAALDKVAVRSVWEYRSDSDQFKVYYPSGIAQGSCISIYRVENGFIAEEWCEYDSALIVEFCRIHMSIWPYEE